MTINARLKLLRKRNDMTLEEVANKVGLSRATVQRYESGVIPGIPSDKIEALAEIYHTTPAYIMGWEEEIKEDPVALAEKHLDVLMDDVFIKLNDKYNKLNAKQRKIVENLIDSLVDD